MHWKKRILRVQKLSNKPFNEYILVMSWELVFLDNSYSRKRYWEQCENVLTLFLLFFSFSYEIISILKIFEKCLLALFSLVISLGLISLAISLGLKRRLDCQYVNTKTQITFRPHTIPHQLVCSYVRTCMCMYNTYIRTHTCTCTCTYIHSCSCTNIHFMYIYIVTRTFYTHSPQPYK